MNAWVGDREERRSNSMNTKRSLCLRLRLLVTRTKTETDHEGLQKGRKTKWRNKNERIGYDKVRWSQIQDIEMVSANANGQQANEKAQYWVWISGRESVRGW
jgi:hypothetical protein